MNFAGLALISRRYIAMNVEGIGRIWGIDADRLDDPNYVPDYVSDEENEEILHIPESLTEDDLKIARTRIFDRATGKLIKEVIYDV